MTSEHEETRQWQVAIGGGLSKQFGKRGPEWWKPEDWLNGTSATFYRPNSSEELREAIYQSNRNKLAAIAAMHNKPKKRKKGKKRRG